MTLIQQYEKLLVKAGLIFGNNNTASARGENASGTLTSTGYLQNPRYNTHGSTLIFVLALGLASGLFVEAMMANALFSCQQIGITLKSQNLARVACESGLDYVIADMNNQFNGGIANYDAHYGIPVSLNINANIPGLKNTTTTVTVFNVAPDNGQNGVLSTLNDTTVNNYDAAQNVPNPYRIVQVTSKVGSATKTIRCVLVPTYTLNTLNWPYALFAKNILSFPHVWNGNNTYQANIYGVNPAHPLPLNVAYTTAHVGTNNILDMVGGPVYSNNNYFSYSHFQIGGNVYCYAIPQGQAITDYAYDFRVNQGQLGNANSNWTPSGGYSTPNNVFNMTPAQPLNQTNNRDAVCGMIYSNNNPNTSVMEPFGQIIGFNPIGASYVNGLKDPGPGDPAVLPLNAFANNGQLIQLVNPGNQVAPPPWGNHNYAPVNIDFNVWGLNDVYNQYNPLTINNQSLPAYNGQWRGGQVVTNGNFQQVTVTPAPNAPTGSYVLKGISIQQGASGLVFQAGAPAPAQNSLYIVAAGQTGYLPPGNYQIGYLEIAAYCNVTVSQPVNLYITGNNAPWLAMISPTSNLYATPGALAIYSNSNKDIFLSGSSMTALVYAPNANVIFGPIPNVNAGNTLPIPVDWNDIAFSQNWATTYLGLQLGSNSLNTVFNGAVVADGIAVVPSLANVFIQYYSGNNPQYSNWPQDQTTNIWTPVIPVNANLPSDLTLTPYFSNYTFNYLAQPGQTQQTLGTSGQSGYQVASWQEDGPALVFGGGG